MIKRLRARNADGDEGFVLIYVLMVITIVTILVGGVLVVTSANIVPSLQSAYGQAATAAAQGGVQAFLADLDTKCGSGANNTVATCSPSAGTSNWTTIYQSTNGAYTASYRWRTVTKTTSGTPYVRVFVDGRVSKGGITVQRTVTADLLGGSSTSCLDYSICTQYETQSPDVLAQLYPARTIALNATAHTAADQVAGTGATAVSWQAPTTGSTASSLNTCNALYYGTGGREYNVSGGGNLTDWKQSTTGGLATYLPCQVTLGSSTKLVAPSNSSNGAGGYYSRDALLLSNSSPGASDGPLLNQPVYTGYQAATDPYGMAGRNYRSFTLDGYSPQVGGTPAAGSTYPSPQYVSAGPQAITTKPTIPSSGACVYTGPTRVLLNSNGTATITSPLTRAVPSGSPSGCYPSAISGGIYGFTTTNLATMSGFTGVFSVANSGTAPASGSCGQSSTGWTLTCLKKYSDATGTLTSASAANTVIYADSGSLPVGPDPSTSTAPYTCTSTYSAAAGATCAWTGVFATLDGNGGGTNGWTSYTAGNTCPTTLASADRLAFECDFNGGTVVAGHDYYKVFRDRMQADLARNTCQAGTVAANQSCVQAFITSELAPANNASHRYIISAATPVTSSATKTLAANAPPLSGDPFFDSTASPGSPTTETIATAAYSYTVSRQVYKCYGVLVLGVCLLNIGGAVIGYQWGSDTTANASTPQFTTTVTNQVATLAAAGSVGKSYFPNLADATQYNVGSGGATGSNGPGDLYLEGTATRSLAIVAANDLIVTGNLAPADATAAGLQLVAQDNVRVYHPVSCVSTDPAAITSTTAGFCPNDVTGLYASIPADGSRPYQQYSNLRPGLANLTITGSIFALGTATSPNCPLWNGGGICGGQFTTDNYSRGTTSLQKLSVTGTIAQVHHGALGQEWEVPDSLGQTRPQSGYNLTATYQNLKSLTSAVNTVDMSGSATATAWHIVSVSSGG